jgi:ASC-1-like (ASCH) protein
MSIEASFFEKETNEEPKHGKDFKYEQALAPEAEIDFEIGKQVLAEMWPELTNSKIIEKEEIEDLSLIEYRSLLYGKLKPALDDTMNDLGISVDNSSLKNISNKEELSEKQLDFIKSLEKQFKDKSVGGKLKETENEKEIDNTWSFYPKEINKKQSVNCSGASLLFGRIAEKAEIKTYQARTTNHAFNVLELDDGKLVYADTRMDSQANDSYADSVRVFVIEKYEKEKIGTNEIIHINDNEEYGVHKDILLLPQFESVGSIVNNFGSLKIEAAKKILPREVIEEINSSSNEETYEHSLEAENIAKQIYSDNQELLNRINFNSINDKLFEDIKELEDKIKKYEEARTGKKEKMNHALRIRDVDKDVFESIKNGSKNIETRRAIPEYLSINENDTLTFICGEEMIKKTVNKVHHFKTIEEMLNVFNFKQIMPFANSVSELREKYYSFPNYKEEIEKRGLIVLEME